MISRLRFFIFEKLYPLSAWLECRYGNILKSRYPRFTHMTTISYGASSFLRSFVREATLDSIILTLIPAFSILSLIKFTLSEMFLSELIKSRFKL